jgi:hypothetical protein
MVIHAGNTYHRQHVITMRDGADLPGPGTVLSQVLPAPFDHLVPVRAGIPGAIPHHGPERWGGPRRVLRNLRKPRPVVSRNLRKPRPVVSRKIIARKRGPRRAFRHHPHTMLNHAASLSSSNQNAMLYQILPLKPDSHLQACWQFLEHQLMGSSPVKGSYDPITSTRCW